MFVSIFGLSQGPPTVSNLECKLYNATSIGDVAAAANFRVSIFFPEATCILFLWWLHRTAGAIAVSTNKSCLRDGVNPGKRRVLWRDFGPGGFDNNGS